MRREPKSASTALSGWAESSRCTLRGAAAAVGALPLMAAPSIPRWTLPPRTAWLAVSHKQDYPSLPASTLLRRCPIHKPWAANSKALARVLRALDPCIIRPAQCRHLLRPTLENDPSAAAHCFVPTQALLAVPSTISAREATIGVEMHDPHLSLPPTLAHLVGPVELLLRFARQKICSCLQARPCRSRRLRRCRLRKFNSSGQAVSQAAVADHLQALAQDWFLAVVDPDLRPHHRQVCPSHHFHHRLLLHRRSPASRQAPSLPSTSLPSSLLRLHKLPSLHNRLACWQSTVACLTGATMGVHSSSGTSATRRSGKTSRTSSEQQAISFGLTSPLAQKDARAGSELLSLAARRRQPGQCECFMATTTMGAHSKYTLTALLAWSLLLWVS